MIEPTDARIDDLVAWLRSQGFSLAGESYFEESFGDWLREFHTTDLRILVQRERSSWELAATPAKSSSWFSLAAWEACLNRGDTVRNPYLEDEVGFLKSHLARMRKAARAYPSLPACLARAEKDRLDKLLIRTPSESPADTVLLAPSEVTEAARRQLAGDVARARRRRRDK